jgi:hypothetical protein
MFRVDIKPQRAAVTRSLSPPPDCATTAGAATGVMAAPERSDSDGANSHRADSHEALQAEAAETIRRELSRLTALLRRHFSQSGAESLLPALADTSNTEAAAGARAFLTQIRTLAEGLPGGGQTRRPPPALSPISGARCWRCSRGSRTGLPRSANRDGFLRRASMDIRISITWSSDNEGCEMGQ